MSMQGFVEQVKKIALNAVESTKPMIVQYGTVIAESPLQIQISQKQIYGKEFFVTRAGQTEFKTGDVLILLRINGGQQYLIFGKKGALT